MLQGCFGAYYRSVAEGVAVGGVVVLQGCLREYYRSVAESVAVGVVVVLQGSLRSITGVFQGSFRA